MTIETIRKGIIAKDWDLVESGFNDISKIFNIEPITRIQPKKSRGRPKKKVEPLVLEEEEDELDVEEQPEPVRKRRRNHFVNTWKDTGKLCTEDRLIDKKLIVAKPVERVRKSPMKKVRCQACDRVVEVHSSLIYDKDGYTCSKCIPTGK